MGLEEAMCPREALLLVVKVVQVVFHVSTSNHSIFEKNQKKQGFPHKMWEIRLGFPRKMCIFAALFPRKMWEDGELFPHGM